jgi:hypothetical protein
MTNVLDCPRALGALFTRYRRPLILFAAIALLLGEPCAQASAHPSLKRAIWNGVHHHVSALWSGSEEVGINQNLRTVSAEEWARVLGALKAQIASEYSPLLEKLYDLRAQILPFYPDAVLYEGRVDSSAGLPQRFVFLRHPQGFTLLTGDAKPIHDLNAILPPRLDTEARVKAYLRFFCSALQDQAGTTFLIVEQPDELPWNALADTTLRQQVAQQLTPLMPRQREGGGWRAEGTMVYWKKLYHTTFEVLPKGEVHLLSDNQKTDVLPLQSPLLLVNVAPTR